MRKVDSIEEYLKLNSHHGEALDVLRQIINSTELVETLKWNAPVYTLNGKNVLGLGAFKNHLSIWFFNGVFLKDEKKILAIANEKTKALRQMRFESLQSINKPIILAYVNEAIENQKLGKTLQMSRKEKTLIIPSILKEAFTIDPSFKKRFQQLTPGKQSEFVAYIKSAKRDATQASRLVKIKSSILKDIELNDTKK